MQQYKLFSLYIEKKMENNKWDLNDLWTKAVGLSYV